MQSSSIISEVSCTIFCHRQVGLCASSAAGGGAVGTAQILALPSCAQGHFETDTRRMCTVSLWKTANYPLVVRPGTFYQRESSNYSRAPFHHQHLFFIISTEQRDSATHESLGTMHREIQVKSKIYAQIECTILYCTCEFEHVSPKDE